MAEKIPTRKEDYSKWYNELVMQADLAQHSEVKGCMVIQGKKINSGDMFIFEKGEIADPVFHEDCTLVVVKVPSIPYDKFEIEQ